MKAGRKNSLSDLRFEAVRAMMDVGRWKVVVVMLRIGAEAIDVEGRKRDFNEGRCSLDHPH